MMFCLIRYIISRGFSYRLANRKSGITSLPFKTGITGSYSFKPFAAGCFYTFNQCDNEIFFKRMHKI